MQYKDCICLCYLDIQNNFLDFLDFLELAAHGFTVAEPRDTAPADAADSARRRPGTPARGCVLPETGAVMSVMALGASMGMAHHAATPPIGANKSTPADLFPSFHSDLMGPLRWSEACE